MELSLLLIVIGIVLAILVNYALGIVCILIGLVLLIWPRLRAGAGGVEPGSDAMPADHIPWSVDAMIAGRERDPTRRQARCRLCGRNAAEHSRLYPVRGTPGGPIYFDCWGRREPASLRSA